VKNLTLYISIGLILVICFGYFISYVNSEVLKGYVIDIDNKNYLIVEDEIKPGSNVYVASWVEINYPLSQIELGDKVSVRLNSNTLTSYPGRTTGKAYVKILTKNYGQANMKSNEVVRKVIETKGVEKVFAVKDVSFNDKENKWYVEVADHNNHNHIIYAVDDTSSEIIELPPF
jgi:ribosomal protein L19